MHLPQQTPIFKYELISEMSCFVSVPRTKRPSQECGCIHYPRGSKPCQGDFHPSGGAQWKHNCLFCPHIRKGQAGEEHQPQYHQNRPKQSDSCHRGPKGRAQLHYTGM